MAACLFAAAAMIRPTGVVLPVFASIPFLLLRAPKRYRAMLLGLLAFAIPAAAMFAWCGRNERVAGVNIVSSDSIQTLFYYHATGVLAYADHLSFNEASNELVHEIGWRGNVFSEPANLDESMLRKSVQVFEQNFLATFIVTVRGLILVAIVPDRNELNEMIGTSGEGPLGLAPSSSLAVRIRRTMNSPALAILVFLQVITILLVWAGVLRALVRIKWTFRTEASCILILFVVAMAMLACAASPAAHARFRVPAMPFLAMLAGIGWLGNGEGAPESMPSHDRLLSISVPSTSCHVLRKAL